MDFVPPFKELIYNSKLNLTSNPLEIIEELQSKEQRYQMGSTNSSDIACYLLKKNYLEHFRLLLTTIEEYHTKINLLLMGRNPFN